MRRGFEKLKLSMIALAGMCALTLPAFADSIDPQHVVDLTTGDATIALEVNGAYFYWTNAHPTGSGVIQSFLRIGSNNDEIQGYNTDAKKYEFDEKGGGFTHSLLLSDIPQVNGYFQFLLDINQRKTTPGSLLSMHELIFFQGDKADVSGFNLSNRSFFDDPTAVAAWDLDEGPDGNSVVEMDYALNPGSGWGDVMVYVPVNLFRGTGEYLYLYSAFGIPNPNNAGYEEWAIMGPGGRIEGGPTPPLAPLPASAAGGLMLLGAVGAGRARRRRSA